MIVPEKSLPLPPGFSDAETYVESLLNFATTSTLLHTLCGGVHILDFLTRSPELYSVIIPEAWRFWFASVEIEDVLDLLMRENLTKLDGHETSWRAYQALPGSLIQYIKDVRAHLLCRAFAPPDLGQAEGPSKQVFNGMNPKKVHEVDNFAKYVDNLVSTIERSENHSITHLADFGAGQNYLGRVLASQPYNRHIIAIESRPHVVAGAKTLDIHAKLTKKALVMRNKKAYRASIAAAASNESAANKDVDSPDRCTRISADAVATLVDTEEEKSDGPSRTNEKKRGSEDTLEMPKNGTGTIQYIEHRIQNGDLSNVIHHIEPKAGVSDGNEDFDGAHSAQQNRDAASDTSTDPSLLVISLHSCGNLVHHGLRTLTTNPSVKAVALIGCCYNLMTERLGPPTHKLQLRPDHPRLDSTAGAYDPQGFPMSERFATFKHAALIATDCSNSATVDVIDCRGEKSSDPKVEIGVRLNITARMMAVQAPQNWTSAESSSFFTRHFFRALLQRIFLDKGVVGAPPRGGSTENMGCSPAGSSWGLANGDGNGTVPIVIGNLKKKCYESFPAYVRGAVEKLVGNGGEIAKAVEDRIGSMSDDEIRAYEISYGARKKELSIVWSLMAFSAGVVEALVVVDRWLWLTEQTCVKHAWVEPVFDYSQSPRNLVIVGVKK